MKHQGDTRFISTWSCPDTGPGQTGSKFYFCKGSRWDKLSPHNLSFRDTLRKTYNYNHI